MKSVDLNTVRELVGHSELKMTLPYAHRAPEHKAVAVEKLERQIVGETRLVPRGGWYVPTGGEQPDCFIKVTKAGAGVATALGRKHCPM